MKQAVLAIDAGTRRIGVAVSDGQRRMALPLETVDAEADAEGRIVELIEEYEVAQVVLGWPLEMTGREGRAVDRVRSLQQRLERRMESHGLDDVVIVRWDERMTTSAADRLLVDAGLSRARRKSAVDQVAACKILEGYLASESNEGKH